MNKIYSWLIVISVVLIGVFTYLSFSEATVESKGKIKIATGSKEGMYYQYALKYKERLEKEKVEVIIIPTSGSNEAQKLLNDGNVNIAFIQGGTIDKDKSDNLEALSSIYFEPLWIFIHKNQRNITKVSDLKGMRISTGLKGSGTEELSKKLLEANGITDKNTKFISLNSTDAKYALKKNRIDILFTVISPNSKLIDSLLSDDDINLLSVKRTKAYEIHFPFLTHFVIPEGSYNLLNNVPSQNINLISTVATLAINKKFPQELIRLIMREVVDVHKEEKLFTSKREFPSTEYLELPVNKAAKKYLEKGESWLESIFPYWIAHSIDHFKLLLIPLLTLLLPLMKGVVPLYKWRVRRRIYHWYRDLIEIENLLEDPLKKDESRKRLETLIQEMSTQTKVPLSYSGELYDLKIHIELVLRKLDKAIDSE